MYFEMMFVVNYLHLHDSCAYTRMMMFVVNYLHLHDCVYTRMCVIELVRHIAEMAHTAPNL